MSEANGSGGYGTRILIILYALGIVYVAAQPMKQETLGMLKGAKAWFAKHVRATPPSIRKEARNDSSAGAKSLSRRSRGDEEERPARAVPSKKARQNEQKGRGKQLDHITPQDKKELNDLLEKL